MQSTRCTSPESAPRYAILSHVWGTHEQTFEEIQAICGNCKVNPQHPLPRTVVGVKIQRCCELAESHGYKYLWIDTCCIDKRSSADLSEAINSMFRYYSLSAICYAFLEDVPCQSAFHVDNCTTRTPFHESRWHRRGWTLQELIAPPLVVFLSSSWTVMGSKSSLATEIQRATGVPASLLRLESRISECSISQRMSWAARRETTRVEDRAYSLLGIFGINVPTLYGEGEKAFRRLQEEIMKVSSDTTLFAWGSTCKFSPIYASIQAKTAVHTGLFPSTPDAFSWNHVTYTPRPQRPFVNPKSSSDAQERLSFVLTAYGVRARVPLAESDGVTLADLSWSTVESSNPVFLALRPVAHVEDPNNPLYYIVGTAGSRLEWTSSASAR